MPNAWAVTADMKNPAHYPLAATKANYVGDGVACVLATSEAVARDALELIDVQYEPLPAVVGLIDESETLDERAVRLGLEGNLCRCTGYHNIVKSVLACAQAK